MGKKAKRKKRHNGFFTYLEYLEFSSEEFKKYKDMPEVNEIELAMMCLASEKEIEDILWQGAEPSEELACKAQNLIELESIFREQFYKKRNREMEIEIVRVATLEELEKIIHTEKQIPLDLIIRAQEKLSLSKIIEDRYHANSPPHT